MQEWNPFFARIFFYLSIAYVWWLTEDDPEKHSELLLRDDEAAAIASPIARLFAASELNKRYGRKILDSNDVVAAIVVLGLYFKRTAPAWERKIAPRRPTQTHGVTPNVPNGSNPEVQHEQSRTAPIFAPDFRDFSS